MEDVVAFVVRENPEDLQSETLACFVCTFNGQRDYRERKFITVDIPWEGRDRILMMFAHAGSAARQVNRGGKTSILVAACPEHEGNLSRLVELTQGGVITKEMVAEAILF